MGGFTLGTVAVTYVVPINKAERRKFHSNFSTCIQEKTLDLFSKTMDLRLSQPNINRKVNFFLLSSPRMELSLALVCEKGFRRNIVGNMA